MALGNIANSESGSEPQVRRRQALSRLGLGAAAIYVAPTVLSLSEARESSAAPSAASGPGSSGSA